MTNECTNLKIYVTKNYDQFILLEENRPVTGNLVMNSINKKNLLIDNPILVSWKMEVLDGQNRLEAAKLKQLPIYYRFAQATLREDISLLQNQKPWAIKDYAHFYRNEATYRFINELVEKHDLPLHFIIWCCDPAKDAFHKFKNGEMEIKSDSKHLTEKFHEFSEVMQVVKVLSTTCGKKEHKITHKFKRAMWNFMATKNYNHKRLLHACNTYPDNVIELLNINSEAIIFHGIKERLFNYNKKGKRLVELD